MDVQALKEMVFENIDKNIALLNELLDLHETEKKEELKALFSKKNELIKDVVANILMIYSLLSFIENEKELELAEKTLAKFVETEPLVKEIIAIYLQIVKIEDINPNLSKPEALIKNKRLVNILTKF